MIRTLVTIAANPLLSAPGCERLATALPQLDCMISIDNYINETTRHAHVILPGTSQIEQPHWDIYAWLFCLTSGGKYSEPVFTTPNRPDEWRVLVQLAAHLGGMEGEIDVNELDNEYFRGMCELRGINSEVAFAASPENGPERILDLAIRSGPFGDGYGENPDGVSLQTFKDNADGIIFGHAKPCGKEAIKTPSGKIELAPEYLLKDIPRLEKAMSRTAPELVLVSRRQLRSLNSWFHNVPTMMKGSEQCTVQIHPDDASSHAINDGEQIKVNSEAGSVTAIAEITSDIHPGVVCLPHGWGHGIEGTRLQVANQHPGTNFNTLVPTTALDAISGNAAINGVPVTIAKHIH